MLPNLCCEKRDGRPVSFSTITKLLEDGFGDASFSADDA
jgi:hypothetical protein